MSLGGGSEDAVLKLRVDTTQAKAELKQFEHDQKRFAEMMGTNTDAATSSFGRFAQSIGMTTVELTAMGVAAAAVAAGMLKLSAEGGRSIEIYQALKIDLEAARRATNNTISDQNLAIIANRAWAAGLHITSQELATLTGFADKVSDAVGGELIPTAEQLVQALASGRTRGLRQFGLDLTESGTKAQNAAAAIKLMNERIADMGPAAMHGGEQLSKLGVAWDNFYESVAISMSGEGPLTSLLTWLADTAHGANATAHAFQGLGAAFMGAMDIMSGQAYFDELAQRQAAPTANDRDTAAYHAREAEMTMRQEARRRARAAAEVSARGYASDTASVDPGMSPAPTASDLDRQAFAAREARRRARSGGGGGGGRGDEAFSLEQGRQAQLTRLTETEIAARTEIEEAAADVRRLSIERDLVLINERADAETSAHERRMEQGAEQTAADRLASEQRSANADAEVAHRERITRMVNAYTQATFQAGLAAVLQGKSASGAARAMIASLASQAGTAAIMEMGLGVAAVAASIWPPNPVAATAATQHFAAAAILGGIGLGAAGLGKAAFGGSFGRASNGGGGGGGGGLVGVEDGAGFGAGRGSGGRSPVNVTVVYQPSTGGYIPDAHIRDLLDQIGEGVTKGYA